MEEQPQAEKNLEPQSVEEAVSIFSKDHNIDFAVDYLKKHPDNIAEFCLQVYELYGEGDKTGIVEISKILKEALKT